MSNISLSVLTPEDLDKCRYINCRHILRAAKANSDHVDIQEFSDCAYNISDINLLNRLNEKTAQTGLDIFSARLMYRNSLLQANSMQDYHFILSQAVSNNFVDILPHILKAAFKFLIDHQDLEDDEYYKFFDYCFLFKLKDLSMEFLYLLKQSYSRNRQVFSDNLLLAINKISPDDLQKKSLQNMNRRLENSEDLDVNMCIIYLFIMKSISEDSELHLLSQKLFEKLSKNEKAKPQDYLDLSELAKKLGNLDLSANLLQSAANLAERMEDGTLALYCYIALEAFEQNNDEIRLSMHRLIEKYIEVNNGSIKKTDLEVCKDYCSDTNVMDFHDLIVSKLIKN